MPWCMVRPWWKDGRFLCLQSLWSS